MKRYLEENDKCEEIIKWKDLLSFCRTKNLRVMREKPVSIAQFKETLLTINSMNPNIPDILVKNYYDRYLELYKEGKKYMPNYTTFGIFSKTQANLKYWICRGYSEDIAKKLLSKRQDNTSLESIKRRKGCSEQEAQMMYKQIGNNISSAQIKSEKFKNKIHGHLDIRYWVRLGHSESEAKSIIKDYQKRRAPNVVKSRRLGDNYQNNNTKIQYWLNLGLDKKAAFSALSERQATRKLERYIEKYGIEIGTKRYNQAIKKWLLTLDKKSDEEKLEILIKKTNRNTFYSKESEMFFEKIISENCVKFGKKLYHAKNEYWLYDKNFKKIVFYDFVDLTNKIIIEYNGSKFHPKPNLNKIQLMEWRQLYSGKTSDEIINHDNFKKSLAIQNGFKIVYVWDFETYEEKITKIKKTYESLT